MSMTILTPSSINCTAVRNYYSHEREREEVKKKRDEKKWKEGRDGENITEKNKDTSIRDTF